MSKTCAVCHKKGDLMQFKTILRAYKINGVYAHAKCVTKLLKDKIK